MHIKEKGKHMVETSRKPNFYEDNSEVELFA